MILFFYGEDSYRLKQKVNQLKEKFITSSLGDTNLVILSGKTLNYDEFIRQILALPFLAKKRLVIVEDLLITGKKEVYSQVAKSLAKVPESTVLVFQENGLPDKRSTLFRELKKQKLSQEFILLKGEALTRWVKNEITRAGGQIDPLALIKLIEYVGNDLWRMSNEIKKLVTYNNCISQESVELLVTAQAQSNIFNLIEATAARNPSRSMQELYKLFNAGIAEAYILTMIVYQYRNLLIVKDFQERTPSCNYSQIARLAKIHPFVAQKTIGLSGKYTLDLLKKSYQKLLDFESAFKVGKIEGRVALELLVYQLTK